MGLTRQINVSKITIEGSSSDDERKQIRHEKSEIEKNG